MRVCIPNNTTKIYNIYMQNIYKKIRTQGETDNL